MTTTQRPAASPTRLATLAVLCVAQFMLMIDVVVVNVALPTIAADLGISEPRLQLIAVSYTVTFGSLLIVFGRAGDVFGRRRLFLLGMTIFTIASLVTGLAGSELTLIAGRAAQGVGAAMVSPTALALLVAAFPDGPDRNRALGYWGAVGSGGAIAGQLLGGILTEAFGWPSIFLVNVPIGIVTVLLASRRLQESRTTTRRVIDVRGASLLAIGLAVLILALTRIADGKVVQGAVVTVIAAVLLLAFGFAEARHDDPLLDRQLLRTGSVAVGNLLLAVNAGMLGGALFFTTLYLQVTLSYSPQAVGFAFAPITLVILVVAPRVGGHVEAVGVRRLLAIGFTMSAIGMVLLARLPNEGSYLEDVFPPLLLLALGSAVSYAPTFIAGTSGVPADRHGVASGVLNASQEIGAAIGVTVLATVAASVGGAGDLSGRRWALTLAATVMALAVLLTRRLPRRP